VPLPRAYRSLPRPSSPPCAQASSTCLRSLDYIIDIASRARAIFLRVTISNRNCVFVSQDRIHKSAIYHLPLSNSADAQRRGLRPRRRRHNRDGKGCLRRCDLRLRFSAYARAHGLLTESVKEVIQPQVPLRLPCYDFAPVTALAFGGLAPCGFRHRLRALTASMA
jgi:hypothetical protein